MKTLIIPWKELCVKFSSYDSWNTALRYLNAEEVEGGVSLKRIWQLLDTAWEECEPGSLPQKDFLEIFYSHPLWLINGAFSESDPQTVLDRSAAVRLASHVQPQRILDFGGGIGTIARLCCDLIPDLERVDILDISKHRQLVQKHLEAYPQIRLLEKASPPYDAVIATEVLEHLLDPIGAVVYINSLLKVGGAFVASWSFAPGIKCHLPENFYLNLIMLWVVRALGFGFYGFERTSSLTYSFVKTSECAPERERNVRRIAKLGRLPLPWDRVLLGLRGL